MITPEYVDNATVDQKIESAYRRSVPMLIKERGSENRYILTDSVRLTENGFSNKTPESLPWTKEIVGDELLIVRERIRFGETDFDEEEFTPLKIVQHCRKYVESLNAAVSGHGGTAQTKRVAHVILHDFAIDDANAWIVLLEYNTRCRPCWSVAELRHIMLEAEKNPPQSRPRGLLRNRFIAEKLDSET